MTRETAPYLITPIGRPKECQPIYVLGPKLGPSYAELVEENRLLREQLDAVQGLRDRAQQWEDEVFLRVQAQCRLDQAMRVLNVLSYTHPELRGLIERARTSIWSLREGP